MPECHQGFTITHKVSRGFIVCSEPTQGTTKEPHYVQMSSQGVMSSKEAGFLLGILIFKGFTV
jgi:hypothetical protein